MQGQHDGKNAVAAIRVSTTKQGTDGDSPDAQKEQIDRFAETKDITIKKYFTFLESASKEQQPMQEAVDYCKNPKNKVELFIIKSIDRFTRGGSLSYDILKNQLENSSVQLVDIYGVISSEQVNTLDHLGFEYKWSIYSPSKKSEILEAERSKDELRDIMSRMIGAEIRYTRMGYYMRQPPYGYESHKIETQNGKRCILQPHPTQAEFIIKMFEMRCQGYDDSQILEKINKMGYRTRIIHKRSKQDRTKVLTQIGGKGLDLKGLLRHLENPIYAGVNCEKWTDNRPISCKFDGLVSFETFNKANRGKIALLEDTGKLTIYRKPPPEHLTKKGVRNPDFPYKKAVMCPGCNKPLFGSASRGKMGIYYPAYHCHKRGHYFRVSKKEFDDTIERFVRSIQLTPDHIDELTNAVLSEWEKREIETSKETLALDERIEDLRAEARLAIEKIKVLSVESAIKYMEEDLVKIEAQIVTLTQEKEIAMQEKPTNIKVLIAYAKYYLEHLDYLLLKQIDPIKKANFFSVLFDKPPTYEDLKVGTQKIAQIPGVNELFRLSQMPFKNVVIPAGFEPAIFWMRTRYPRPLDDGTISGG